VLARTVREGGVVPRRHLASTCRTAAIRVRTYLIDEFSLLAAATTP